MQVAATLERTPDEGTQIVYFAAAPADRRASFSGAGLPFASFEQAMHETPNRGVVTPLADQPGVDTQVTVQLAAVPNAYYASLGTVYVPPTLYLRFVSGGKAYTQAVPVPGQFGAPYRTLTYPGFSNTRARRDATFYEVPEQPARSQEAILRASEYPERQAANFWGDRPPV
jgi:hypothetical protein